MTLRWTLKRIAHRTGFLASPSLAFQDVPFGPKRRNLAGELMRDIDQRHQARLDTIRVRPQPEHGPDAYDYWCPHCDRWLAAEMTYGSNEREARECGLDHMAEEHAGVPLPQ
jgi:hypothetical protein